MAMARHWKPLLLYGALLAAGVLILAWFDTRRLMWRHGDEIWTVVIATGFLVAGVLIGARVISAGRPIPFDGNPQAQAALGISARERAVLEQLAAGRSNREIADALNVSPNTVKTHIARLFEKLEAKRRTDAIARARELGLIR